MPAVISDTSCSNPSIGGSLPATPLRTKVELSQPVYLSNCGNPDVGSNPIDNRADLQNLKTQSYEIWTITYLTFTWRNVGLWFDKIFYQDNSNN